MIILSARVLVHFQAPIWSEPDDLPPTENLNSCDWFLRRGLNRVILSVTTWTVLYFSKHRILLRVCEYAARAPIDALKTIIVGDCNAVFSFLFRSRWIRRSWCSRCAIWDHRGASVTRISVHIENGLWTLLDVFLSSLTSFCCALVRC